MDDALVHRRRWATLAVLCVSLLIIGLDNTVLNVALPTLQKDLGASASALQWIVDAYTLAFAGLLLTAGSWGDRFGRKRALQLGLLGFAASSVWGAYAGDAGQLVAARTLMGLSAAFIMPSTLSILTNSFRDPRERKRAIGIWSGVSGIGVAVGPWLGGWLLEHYWWGSIFLINVGVALVGLLLGALVVPESRDPASPRLDLVGAALSTAGLVALVWAIIEAPSRGWTEPSVLVAFGAALVVLTAFVLWELRTPQPMLDMHLFRRRRFSVPSVSIALVFFALFGSAFFLSIYLQTVAGYDALSAGVRILPIAIGLVLGAPLSMAVAVRAGEKLPTVLGLVTIAGAFGVIAGTDVSSAYFPRMVVAVVLLGFGIAFAMTPATEAVMGSLPRAKAGIGSAVNDMVRQVGGALGVAVLGSILNGVYAARVADALRGLPPSAAGPAGDNLQAAYAVSRSLPPEAAARLVADAQDAFVHAMDVTVLVAGGLVLLGAVVAAVWLPAHGTHPDDEPPETAEAAPAAAGAPAAAAPAAAGAPAEAGPAPAPGAAGRGGRHLARRLQALPSGGQGGRS